MGSLVRHSASMEARNNVQNKVKAFIVRSVLLSGQFCVCAGCGYSYLAASVIERIVSNASPVNFNFESKQRRLKFNHVISQFPVS